MPFPITLHFVSAHDRDHFVDRVLPRLHGHQVEPPPDENAEAHGYHRVAFAVTSPTAAREVCRQAFGFLAHMKNARIVFAWPNPQGALQYGEVVSGEARDADLLSTRLGAAAKAFLDAEKQPPQPVTESAAAAEETPASEG